MAILNLGNMTPIKCEICDKEIDLYDARYFYDARRPTTRGVVVCRDTDCEASAYRLVFLEKRRWA